MQISSSLKMGKIKKEKSIGKGKLVGADGIRALACLAVIGHHLSQRLSTQAEPKVIQEVQAFFLMGSAGVSIFFVLSGFLLSYPFWKNYLNEVSFPNIKQYIIRRGMRIMPGYYIAIIASTIAAVLLKIHIDHFGIRLLAGFTFTAGFHYVTFFPTELNGALWSISFEVFSYVLMPIFMFGLFMVSRKKRSFIKSLIYWLIVVMFIVFINNLVHKYLTPDNINRGWQFGEIGGAKYWMTNYNPIGFFGHFSMGIIAAGITTFIFKSHTKFQSFKNIGGFDVIGILALVGAYFLLWELRHAPEFSFSLQNQPYFFPSFAILIGITLMATPHSLIIGKVLDNPFFKFTSKISFGLYVWHYFIITLVSYVWYKQYQYMLITDIKLWAVISAIIVVVAYIIATISYYFIEKPLIDLGHKIPGNIQIESVPILVIHE